MITQHATEAPGLFSITSWRTVLLARDPRDTAGADALERLLTRYYPPIRRIVLLDRRCQSEQADDLTQEFIKECLRRDFLKDVGPEKGRFRTFIRRCLEHFLRDESVRSRAQKRGGGISPLPLETDGSDELHLPESVPDTLSPGEMLDLEWARHVVQTSLERLERECKAALRGALYEELKGCLVSCEELSGAAALAARFEMEEGAVHVARHRLRQRLGELIAEEVQATTTEHSDWRDELRYLIRLTGSVRRSG